MRRDYRFMTPYEKEWDRAFALAMAGMGDQNSDETQELCEQAVDDPSDLQALAAFWVRHRDAAACHDLLAKLFDRHVERVANEAAEKACETVPQERAA